MRDPDAPLQAVPLQLQITAHAAEALLGSPVASASKGMMGKTVLGNPRFIESAAPARNVVGIIPGSDAALRGQFVAIGAHNDHIGFTSGNPVDHDSLHLFNEARFATPGLKIVIPSSPYEAKGLLLAAIRDPDPVLFFEHKRLYRMFKEPVPKGEYLIPLQVARTVREGSEISVFCYGLMVHYALEAAKALDAEGVNVEIVDLRTVYPLDKEAILASARKTGKCLVLYEDNFSVSIGSEIAALIADEAWRWLDAPVKRLGGLDVPSMPYAPAMEDFFMPNPEKITQSLRELAAY